MKNKLKKRVTQHRKNLQMSHLWVVVFCWLRPHSSEVCMKEARAWVKCCQMFVWKRKELFSV